MISLIHLLFLLCLYVVPMESMNQTGLRFEMDVEQGTQRVSNTDCEIALNAWSAMGGSTDEFPQPFHPELHQDCCGSIEIGCIQGQIIEIKWFSKGLFGPLSPLLGQLTRLRKLYECLNEYQHV